ncbi:MAG TPA: hypothetical protein VH255_01595 [Verrucomicrobiae bacterium]|nr:hypothetical protein [Verrucomicrobiae bacterium]
MKLFTFSGISGTLSGTNDGSDIIDLAEKVIAALPTPSAVRYEGVDDVDHFRSYIDYETMLSNIGDAVQLSGVTVLNEEANRLSPNYAVAMSNAVSTDPTEDVLILAHSQGTNNLTWTLLNLAKNEPDFFTQRNVRCALFDPKVGSNYMEQVFALFPDQSALSFLFFQSENDILGDQSMLIPKFIDEFPHGNHIWVKGLDHTSIHEWAMLNKNEYWLDLFGYQDYERAWRQEVIALKQQTRSSQMGTAQVTQLHNWSDQYAKDEMNYDKISPALLGFLMGNLPAKYKSK